MKNDVLYKPKHVICFENHLGDFIGETINIVSVAECNILNEAIFQVEIYEKNRPINGSVFNISDIFMKIFALNDDNDFSSIKNFLDKNILSIFNFNILFYVSDKYMVAWPDNFEKLLINNIIDDNNIKIKDIISYDEFIIKSLLE